MEDTPEKKKILLVDDDIMFQNVVASMLKDKYIVFTSESGKDALVTLIKNKPDLILLDVVMPYMDGWEIFHHIRGISVLQHVPIAFLTSLSEAEDLERAKDLGARDYFIKPVNKSDFLDRIGKILMGDNVLDNAFF